MADAFYNKFLHALGLGTIDLSTGNFRLALVDTGTYTVDTSDTGHQYESDLSGVLTEPLLVTPTWVNRVFDAADFSGTYTDPGGGGTGEAFVLYKDTGTPATSPLIAYFDSPAALPITLDGTDDSITFNASGIFKIGP